jgi:hypothetical protein
LKEDSSPMIKPPVNTYDSLKDAKEAAKKVRGTGKQVKIMKTSFTHPRTGEQTHTFSLKEESLDEREMTAADKKKEEKLKSKYDDSGMKASMQKQYGAEKGKQVYFAYIRKKAMKNEQADTTNKTSSGTVGDSGRV